MSQPVGVEAITRATARLLQAHRTRIPCAPVRDLIGDDLQAAYLVQGQLVAQRVAAGERVVGRKIGATSKAVQDQLGVDQPDFGFLLDSMEAVGGVLDLSTLVQPRIEAEIAFVLAEDLITGPLDADQIRSAVRHASAALEVVDSRIRNWDITFPDTVADNASSGMFVLGDETATLDEWEARSASMELSINDEVASVGNGAACLGDPLEAVSWLARRAREFGEPLRAGQVILSGALGPFVPLEAGDSVVATISGLGSVTAEVA